MHKLGMVLAAAKSNELILQAPDLILAEQMITTLEQDMPLVFETIGQNDTTRGMSSLVKVVLLKRKITKSALYRIMFKTMNAEEFTRALESARMAGYLKLTTEGRDDFVIALEEAPRVSD